MRGSRVKALRRGYKEVFGFAPTKTRRVTMPARPRHIFERIWWWVTRQKPMVTVTHRGTWRRWKRLAQAADRGE